MRNALSFLLLIPLAACAHNGPRPADDAPVHFTAWGDRVTREILMETNRPVHVRAYAYNHGQPLKEASLRDRNRNRDHFVPIGLHARRINLVAPQTLILVATREPVRRTLGQSSMPSLEQAVEFLAHELTNLPTGPYDVVVVAF
jgi:hypothetical protein